MKLNLSSFVLYLIGVQIILFENRSYAQLYQNQILLPIVNPKVLINEHQIADNPAIIHFVDNNYACFSYTISKFGLKEISPMYADIGMKFSEDWGLGLSLYGLGNELYNEFAIMLMSSYKLTDKIIAGISCEYIRMSIKDNFADYNFQFHFGTMLIISKKLTTGFSFKNITREYFTGGESTANQIATAGICYTPIDNISFEFGGIVRLATQSGFLVHFLYEPFDFTVFRVSYATAPKLFNIAIKLNTFDWINISFNLQYHNILGFAQTPAISLYW